jgi:predicted patatin/cPLA2 family phospholipase
MRGAWAVGALNALHELGEDRFDLVVASSSGACSAAYFVAGLHQPALEIWQHYVDGRKLFCTSNLLHFKPMVDLTYLVDHLFRKKFPLNLQAFNNGVRFQIVLTDCLSGAPVYFPARDEQIFDALRASSSLPFATRGYWLVDQKPFADGGIGDPLPLEHVLEEGAKDITVILTHGSAYRMEPVPRFVARLAYPKYPRAAEAWAQRHIRYQRSLALMDHPPEGVRIRVLRPSRRLYMARFTCDMNRLLNAISFGREEVFQQLGETGTLKKY